MNEIEAIIFDWDGTLADTKDFWDRKNMEDLENVLKRKLTEDEAKKYFGPGFRDILKSLGVDQGKVVEIIKQRDEEYIKNLNHIKLFPEVIFALEDLKFNGYKLGLLTNNRKQVIDKILEHFQIKDKFDVVLGDEFESKPNPTGLLKAIEILGIDKEKTMYVGDTDTDRETAENAGVIPAIIGKEIRGVEEITAYINWFRSKYRYF